MCLSTFFYFFFLGFYSQIEAGSLENFLLSGRYGHVNTHLNLVLRRVSGFIQPFPPYVFVTWRSFKHKNSLFTFTLPVICADNDS